MLEIQLELVKPNRPDVVEMLQEADAYFAELYPVEHNHLLNVETLMQPNIKFVLALLDGEAVGCGAIRLWQDFAEVKRMYVRPPWRGAGVGHQVLSKLETLAKDLGFTNIRLETGIYQLEAMRLYERSGYIKCSPFGDYLASHMSLFYEKHLQPN